MDPTWIDAASKFGVPVVILAAVWYGLSKMVRWMAAELVIPIRDRGIKYLDDNLLWMRALGTRLEQLTDENTRHHAWEEERLDELAEKITDIGRTKGFDWQPTGAPSSDPKKTGRP